MGGGDRAHLLRESETPLRVRRAMDASVSLARLRKEASCAVCRGYFRDPVSIHCGHSFCRRCLAQCWGEREGSASCPQCGENCPLRSCADNPHLARIADSVQRLHREASDEPGICGRHQERLSVFCKEDQRPICLVCVISREHRHHTAIPVEDAGQIYKDQCQMELKTLRQGREKLQALKFAEERRSRQLLEKLDNEGKRAVSEFQHLHQFLEDQEQLLLARLEQLENEVIKEKKTITSKLSEEITNLSDLISEIEEKCKQPVNQFLQDLKNILSRCENQKIQQPTEHSLDLEKRLSAFSEETMCLEDFQRRFKGGLSFELKSTSLLKHASRIPKARSRLFDLPYAEIAKRTGRRVNVTLDPDTANPFLILSADQKSVRLGDEWQDVSDNPERFDTYPCVLGCERFTSGRLYWEVEVGRGSYWAVGFAKESVRRKGEITPSPEEQIWALQQYGDYFEALTYPVTTLSLSSWPRRIQVFLDYEEDCVAFFDADTASLIYTFSPATLSQERILPWLWVWPGTELRLYHPTDSEARFALQPVRRVVFPSPIWMRGADSGGGRRGRRRAGRVWPALARSSAATTKLPAADGISRERQPNSRPSGRAAESERRFAPSACRGLAAVWRPQRGVAPTSGWAPRMGEPKESLACLRSATLDSSPERSSCSSGATAEGGRTPLGRRLSLRAVAPDSMCAEHGEPFRVFCKEDRALLCLVCDRSRRHWTHTVLPVEEAAQEYKNEILQSLKTERWAAQKCQVTLQKCTTKYLKEIKIERQTILQTFQKFRLFLVKQESLLLAQLRELEKEVEKVQRENYTKLCDAVTRLGDFIGDLQEDCQRPDREFLQDINESLSWCERGKCCQPLERFPDPEKLDTISQKNIALMEGLQKFKETLASELKKGRIPWLTTAWGGRAEKPQILWPVTCSDVKGTSTKVNVTLDPRTANFNVVISLDRKTVRHGKQLQALPDNPERFDSEPFVLGCEGFCSGKHCWVVSIEAGRSWAVGVARESVKRKGYISLSPEQGIWAVEQCWGQFQALTTCWTPLSLCRKPRRIRVSLDYERGQVAFFDANLDVPIFAFPPISFRQEKIFPWLWVGPGSQLCL
ncbi:uncharacterized protein LOC143834496 [Paroedura picta]|uniref:uncharacterized protein LOC143834496 n=1 Tax=Paroedura picta TaxID=143630 RepID=UPI0040571F0E